VTVKRWHVPPVIGKIESGVPTVEVVAAADYDALYRLLRQSWSVDDIEQALTLLWELNASRG
jgi:hypothetical protein